MNPTKLRVAASLALLLAACKNTGPAGKTGPAGPAGVPGGEGATGLEGPTGVGASGVIWMGDWSTGTQYAATDAVWDLNGSSYIAVVPAPQPGADPAGDLSEWNLLAAGGAAGPTGAAGAAGPAGLLGTMGPTGSPGATGSEGPPGSPSGLIFLGPHDTSTTYVANDVITFAGATYVCTAATCTGETPTDTEYWAAISLPSVTSGTDNLGVGTAALAGLGSGRYNSAFGVNALAADTDGNFNTAMGTDALSQTTRGGYDTAVGTWALADNVSGHYNEGVGVYALNRLRRGDYNAALGSAALGTMTEGGNNTAVGSNALELLTSGNDNIALGQYAGHTLAGGESNDILIGSTGMAGQSNTIYLGTQGTQTATYIAGIAGVTLSPSGGPVYINSDGQLGTVNSSRRYKEDIRDIGSDSSVLMSLRPVAFKYKPEYDPAGEQRYGLIAEEVEEWAPQLVLYDSAGQPQSVRYDLVNALLLNEVQRQERESREQRSIVDATQAIVQQDQTALAGLLSRLEHSDSERAAQERTIQAQQQQLAALQAGLAAEQTQRAQDARAFEERLSRLERAAR